MHRTISSIAEPTPLPDIADASIKHSGENPHSKRGRKKKEKKKGQTNYRDKESERMRAEHIEMLATSDSVNNVRAL